MPQETAFTQNHTWMPYLNAKEPMLPFLESMETKPASVGAGLPPSWLSPVSLSPCDSPLTQDDHTPPPKRMRSESHAPNHRRSSTPARPASDTESLRAWLLQRRAQLQQKQADIRQAQATLKEQQGHWAHVQTLLSARIAKLSQNRTLAPAPSSLNLGLLGSEELDDPLWDAAPVSSVADLLEQNILCL